VIHSGFLKYAIICVKNQICAYIAVVKWKAWARRGNFKKLEQDPELDKDGGG
jgi:hypothetical protein